MVSLGLNQSPDMVKYMVYQITEFVLNNLYCQRKMILDGSRKTMNFIVLPCNIKNPYSMEYNTIFVPKNSDQISNNLIIL